MSIEFCCQILLFIFKVIFPVNGNITKCSVITNPDSKGPVCQLIIICPTETLSYQDYLFAFESVSHFLKMSGSFFLCSYLGSLNELISFAQGFECTHVFVYAVAHTCTASMNVCILYSVHTLSSPSSSPPSLCSLPSSLLAVQLGEGRPGVKSASVPLGWWVKERQLSPHCL